MTPLSTILLHSGVPEQGDAQCGRGGYQGGRQGGRQGDAVFAWSVKAGELAATDIGSWVMGGGDGCVVIEMVVDK